MDRETLFVRGDVSGQSNSSTNGSEEALRSALNTNNYKAPPDTFLGGLVQDFGPRAFNYCGKGYSSGKVMAKGDYNVPAINAIDQACKKHDMGYELGRYADADEAFLEELNDIRPSNPYEYLVKKSAQGYFNAKRAFFPEENIKVRGVEADDANRLQHAINGNGKNTLKNKERRQKQKAKKAALTGKPEAAAMHERKANAIANQRGAPQRSRVPRTPRNVRVVATSVRKPVRRRPPRLTGSSGPGGSWVGSAQLRRSFPTDIRFSSAHHPKYGPGLRMRGWDYLADIGIPGQVYHAGDLIASWVINPTTWGKVAATQMCALFTYWRSNKLSFNFQTSTSTNTTGSIIFYPDYDGRDTVPNVGGGIDYVRKARHHTGSKETNIYQSKFVVFRSQRGDPKVVQLSGDNGGAQGLTSDPLLSTEGVFNILALDTFTCPSGGIGTIDIFYDIDFFVNELQISGGSASLPNPYLLWGLTLSGVGATNNVLGNSSIVSMNADNGTLSTMQFSGFPQFNYGEGTMNQFVGLTAVTPFSLLYLPYDPTGSQSSNLFFVFIGTDANLTSNSAITLNNVGSTTASVVQYANTVNSGGIVGYCAIISVTQPYAQFARYGKFSLIYGTGSWTLANIRIFIMMLDATTDEPQLKAMKRTEMDLLKEKVDMLTQFMQPKEHTQIKLWSDASDEEDEEYERNIEDLKKMIKKKKHHSTPCDEPSSKVIEEYSSEDEIVYKEKEKDKGKKKA